MNRKPFELRGSRRRGFTLIELLVVMIIISILLGFIFAASMEAGRRAEERATQSLITKLETGLNDRLEALLQNIPDPNFAHGYMAAIFYTQNYTSTTGTLPLLVQTSPSTGLPILNASSQQIPNTALTQTLRAKVFGAYDFIKSELPDVFYIQTLGAPYPLNFAGTSYPGSAIDPNQLGNFILPLGNSIAGPYTSTVTGFGDGNYTNPNLGLSGSGIYGASYAAAGGIYKNLGYYPQGYDGVDNSNPPNGLVDEWSEGVDANNSSLVLGNLGRHTHNTARSEMLYALLVEGRGPLGSVFSRDDFTDKEVQDTDGDGLPEFVDAWGQPLQFFRWPLLYHSDLQRGQLVQSAGAVVDQTSGGPGTLLLPYKNVIDEREQDPLDVNQQLMAPSWWSSGITGGVVAANLGSPFASLGPPPSASAVNASGGVTAFEYFFHRLTEPLANTGFTNAYAPQPWDRGSYPNRRAFYSKFLILSGGLDQQPGVFLYADADMQGFGLNAALPLILNENNAMPLSPFDSNNPVDFTSTETINSFTPVPQSSNILTHPSNYDLMQWALDDISNQNIQSAVGIGGTGS
jgi:prepilin-type N-terminal cleavage/methylation domain-containing protein